MVEIITGRLPETLEEREGKMVIKERNQKAWFVKGVGRWPNPFSYFPTFDAIESKICFSMTPFE
jgi:hypothetical protein